MELWQQLCPKLYYFKFICDLVWEIDNDHTFCANRKKVKTWISIKDTPRENINFLFSLLLDKLNFEK